MPVLLAWTPYLLVALVLLVTRWPGLGLVPVLQGYSLDVERILGQDLSFSLRYLYLPGIVPFIPVVVLTAFVHRMSARSVAAAWRGSARLVLWPAITLVIAVSMTQIMIQSATNELGRPGMMQALSTVLAAAAGPAIPFVAPWIGTLGTFVTGSNTSSNILFSVLQHDAAGDVGLSRTIVVALQNVGGGIGNMISVLNIAAISGVVGMTGREGEILRRTLAPTVVYAVLAGVMGLALALLFGGVY
jgi:lactate permease